MCPIPLASVLPDDNGVIALTSGWIAIFTLEVMLYVVGTAFLVLVLSKERSVRIHKDAASTDELTGVLNRRGFLSGATLLIERFAKRREPVSVLVFDLDNFKRVNDSFGHAVGDETLRLFASVASINMRASDIFGRFGGEEFVAILPGNVNDAAIAAERVRAAFEVAGTMVCDQLARATVSIGVASGEPGADVISLIAAADRALYKAKDRGRNRIELAVETPSAPPEARPEDMLAGSKGAPAPALAS
jgi:diguanylate cyclase (GGDEF)-like protein